MITASDLKPLRREYVLNALARAVQRQSPKGLINALATKVIIHWEDSTTGDLTEMDELISYFSREKPRKSIEDKLMRIVIAAKVSGGNWEKRAAFLEFFRAFSRTRSSRKFKFLYPALKCLSLCRLSQNSIHDLSREASHQARDLGIPVEVYVNTYCIRAPWYGYHDSIPGEDS